MQLQIRSQFKVVMLNVSSTPFQWSIFVYSTQLYMILSLNLKGNGYICEAHRKVSIYMLIWFMFNFLFHFDSYWTYLGQIFNHACLTSLNFLCAFPLRSHVSLPCWLISMTLIFLCMLLFSSPPSPCIDFQNMVSHLVHQLSAHYGTP